MNASSKIVMDLFVCLFQMSPDTILIQILIYEVFPVQLKSLYVHIYFFFIKKVQHIPDYVDRY